MKKVLSVILLLIIVFSLVACAKEENVSKTVPTIKSEMQTSTNEYENDNKYLDTYAQIRFPLSVDYIDYVNPTYNESYKFAFLDVNDNYIKVIPHDFTDLSFGTDNTNIKEIIAEYQNTLPQYLLETGKFYDDVSTIEFMNKSFIESSEFTVTNDGYYLRLPFDTAMHTSAYAIAKWSSSGKYQGLYRTGSNKYADYYGYCGNYILEGYIKKTPAEEYILYFKDFTCEHDEEIIVLDLKELEKEFNVTLDYHENGFCDIEGELSVETITSDEDGVVLLIKNKTNDGVKIAIGKVSLTGKCFEIIDTLSYNL